ncbi:hypothetical protein KEJ24_09050 [Candidatus Bathyarchaeota archaeon]|nr:hypothetical protein [Candidatus Bathyarchaeota archaeon]
MKRQIGVRIDAKIWSQFKELCSQNHLRPNEALEAFIKTCLDYQSVADVLRNLEGANVSEKKTYEIQVRKVLTELDAYLTYDMKHGEAENYSNIVGCIENITKILPKITNQNLTSEAETKINEALAYYRKIFEKGETPPEDIILFRVKMN